MVKKYYTVEDWKNGSMHEDLLNRNLPKDVLSEVKNVGYLSELLFRKEQLAEEDHLEILKIMKDTFFKVLEHNVEQRFLFFIPDLDSAYRPEHLLNERINKLQRLFDNAESYYKEQALKGDWSKVGIDHEVYEKIHNANYKRNSFSIIQFTPSRRFERLGGFHRVFTNKYYQFQNVLFDVSEIFRLREKLLEFKNEGLDLNSDKRKQGTHLDKKVWIKNKFDELRPESSSDNEAVESVMKAYHEKFEKKIGKSTAQRYIGLVK